MPAVKPRMRAASLFWMERLVCFVVEHPNYLITDQDLEPAPSDLFDGWAYAIELRDLVRRRIFYTMPVEAECQTLGNKVTWGLTARGCAIVRGWADPTGKLAANARSQAYQPAKPQSI